MVKINKIYTRSGDDGTTGLVGGTRIKKHSLRVETYGEVDQLNSFVGWTRTVAEKLGVTELAERLALVQNELFDLGAELATPNSYTKPQTYAITESQATRLEEWIDGYTASLPELQSFVLPGGNELNSLLHVCRTTCRRAERITSKLADEESISKAALIYLNRLSDLFFAMARAESKRAGIEEYLWKPGGK